MLAELHGSSCLGPTLSLNSLLLPDSWESITWPRDLCCPRPLSLGRGLEAAHYSHLYFLLSQLMSHSWGAHINPSSLHCYHPERDQLYDHMILETKNDNKGCYLLVSCRSTSKLETEVTSTFLLCIRQCQVVLHIQRPFRGYAQQLCEVGAIIFL